MKSSATLWISASCSAAILLGQLPTEADGKDSGNSSDGGVAGTIGPDIIAGAITGFAAYGAVSVGGETVMGYALGSTGCNIGDVQLDWFAAPSNRHPYITQNVYRIKDGRIRQIGMGWGRHGFAALQQMLCSTCVPAPQMTHLGVGCASPYTASLNGDVQSLGARSEVNASTGAFPGTYNAGMPPAAAAIGRRIQLKANDLNPALNAGAVYVAESHFIHFADAAAGNGHNNASWRAVNVGALQGFNYQLTLSGPTNQRQPAIHAWRAADAGVTLTNADVADDGRFILGAKVSQNADGSWRYEYAVQNLNSDRAGRSFEVPLAVGATVVNAGFSDIAYHSGDPYDGSDWSVTTTEGAVRWTGPTHATQPNGNALRFSTLYNFWFDASVPPTSGSAVLGLFKPGAAGAPGSLAIATQVPGAAGNPADLNGDGVVNAADLAALLANWNGSGAGDIDGDGAVGASDLAALLGSWSA